MAEIELEFKKLHANYYEYEWVWAAELLVEKMGKPINDITIDDLLKLIKQWKESVVGLDQLLYEDAKKEFRLDSMTGFGMDGNKTTQKLDFEKVRGNFENNDFVNEIINHIERKTLLGQQMTERLTNMQKSSIN